MGDTNDAVFDEIWTFIEEKLKLPVPTYFKYVLNYCGYNNGISIATIEPDDIPHIVSEVRSGNVKNYFTKLIGEIDVLEGSTKTAENFEFSRGHFKYLMSIVDFLKKYAEDNGPDSFTITKQKKKSKIIKSLPNIPRKRFKYSKDNQTEMGNDIDKQKNVLHKKMLNSLKNHTPRLYAENNSKIKEKMDSDQLIVLKVNLLNNMTTESETSEDINTESETAEILEDNKKTRKYEASMFCPYCLKTTNVFYVSGCNWNSSNFDRHLKQTHSESVNSDSVNGKVRDESDDNFTDVRSTEGSETDASKDAEPDATNVPNVIVMEFGTGGEMSDAMLEDAVIVFEPETKDAKMDADRSADRYIENVVIFVPGTAGAFKNTEEAVAVTSGTAYADAEASAKDITHVIEIQSKTTDVKTRDVKNADAVTSCAAKDAKTDNTNETEIGSGDKDITAPLSNSGEISKRIVFYTESDGSNDSDSDVDGKIACDPSPNENSESGQSKIPVLKAKEKASICKAGRVDDTNQPTTSRQILGQITNQKMNANDWKTEREKNWKKYF